ncbi:hypothetical protein RCL1_008379 [Eukaryota sp. TZLM3-RCL]
MLVYGSFDSGVTITTNPCAERVASSLGAKLNLKKHFVYPKSDQSKMIDYHLSLNSELYMSLDGSNFYLRSVAQLMPPDAPQKNSIDHVVKLFIPEFVSTYSETGELIPGV